MCCDWIGCTQSSWSGTLRQYLWPRPSVCIFSDIMRSTLWILWKLEEYESHNFYNYWKLVVLVFGLNGNNDHAVIGGFEPTIKLLPYSNHASLINILNCLSKSTSYWWIFRDSMKASCSQYLFGSFSLRQYNFTTLIL